MIGYHCQLQLLATCLVGFMGLHTGECVVNSNMEQFGTFQVVENILSTSGMLPKFKQKCGHGTHAHNEHITTILFLEQSHGQTFRFGFDNKQQKFPFPQFLLMLIVTS